jgi:hypothetical protein
MTQDLRGNETPPNAPKITKFYLMCTWCGRRDESVKFSNRVFANICQPKCPTTKTN